MLKSEIVVLQDKLRKQVNKNIEIKEELDLLKTTSNNLIENVRTLMQLNTEYENERKKREQQQKEEDEEK